MAQACRHRAHTARRGQHNQRYHHRQPALLSSQMGNSTRHESVDSVARITCRYWNLDRQSHVSWGRSIWNKIRHDGRYRVGFSNQWRQLFARNTVGHTFFVVLWIGLRFARNWLDGITYRQQKWPWSGRSGKSIPPHNLERRWSRSEHGNRNFDGARTRIDSCYWRWGIRSGSPTAEWTDSRLASMKVRHLEGS